jgi:hypothetical protein
MKKAFLPFILLFTVGLMAQNQKIIDLRDKTENSKSGNYKDIFTSFFQLATTNFTGNEKTFDINTTLFAVKAKANPDLLQDINYVKETFSRNFQFNFKVNLDQDYKYKGFTGGATYALMNKRDRQLANFAGTALQKNYKEILKKITIAQNTLIDKTTRNSNLPEAELIKMGNAMNLYIESLLNLEDVKKETLDSLAITQDEFDAISNSLTTEINKDSNIKTNIDALHALKKEYFDTIDAKPLWTLFVDGSANEDGKFNKASIGSVFLQGNKNGNQEIDIRAKLTYQDTLSINPMPRIDFKTTAGVNFKISKNKDNVSFFEVKAALEYNSILKNALENEKKDNFFANAEIRIRLTNDLWFPLLIKYDIEKANFLGFLNLTYNFGGFQNK